LKLSHLNYRLQLPVNATASIHVTWGIERMPLYEHS
jgi:hypothetical protein